MNKIIIFMSSCLVLIALGGCALNLVPDVGNFIYSTDNATWQSINCESYCANAETTNATSCNQDCSEMIFYDERLGNEVNVTTAEYFEGVATNGT